MAKPNLKLSVKRNSGRGNEDLKRLLAHGEVEEVPLDLIDRDEGQPRPLDEVLDGIDAFADELERDDFVLAQLPVYHIEDNGRRTIVVGERRTTAFRLKGRETIPAICKRFTDAEREQIFVLQYVENDGKLKKELSPIADARWWRAYADRYHNGKLSDAAKARGRTPAEISNRVSLLDAAPIIQEFVQRIDLKDPATFAALSRLAKHGNLRMVEQVISDYEAGAIRGSFRGYVELLARDTKARKTQKEEPKIDASAYEPIEDEQDSLYDEAVSYVTETRKASISSLQRHLKVGYNRAARLIEAMEKNGVVSAMGCDGTRTVGQESGGKPTPKATPETCAKALTRSIFDEAPECEAPEPPPTASATRAYEYLSGAQEDLYSAQNAAAKLLANSGSGLHYDRVLSAISDAIRDLEQSQAAYTAERTALLAKAK